MFPLADEDRAAIAVSAYDLTPRQARIFVALYAAPYCTLSTKTIAKVAAMEVHKAEQEVCYLRPALGPHGFQIKRIRSTGYRLMPPPDFVPPWEVSNARH